MSHKFKMGQTVVQAFRGVDRSITYQVVRLEPPRTEGKPRYIIKCRLKGHQRLVQETEIVPAFP